MQKAHQGRQDDRQKRRKELGLTEAECLIQFMQKLSFGAWKWTQLF